jgi:hypothetical protein
LSKLTQPALFSMKSLLGDHSFVAMPVPSGLSAHVRFCLGPSRISTHFPSPSCTQACILLGRIGSECVGWCSDEVVVEGVRTIQLSVDEKSEHRDHSAGLEFVGVDTAALAAGEASSSTALPAFYSFQSLATAFARKPSEDESKDEEQKDGAIPLAYFNNPSHPRDLITALLPKLTWVPSGKEDGQKQLRLAGVEVEVAKVNREPPQIKGEMVYTRVHITARGLPKEKTTVNPPVAVLDAMNEETGPYQQIAHSALTHSGSGASSSTPVEFKGSVILPHYQFVDGPLRMGLFEVDASKSVMPTSCLDEVKWLMQALMSKADTVLKLKLLKNGKPVRTVRGEHEPLLLVSHSPSSAEDEAEKVEKVESREVSEAPVAFQPNKTPSKPKSAEKKAASSVEPMNVSTAKPAVNAEDDDSPPLRRRS